MARYIDADVLIKNIAAIADMRRLSTKTVGIAIDDTPTAEVVEVRHGRWKKVYDKSPRYMCTVCNHLFNNKEYKYCPNCGAKMDRKDEDECRD